MENSYPCFDSRGIREEYSEKINNIFEKNNFNWTACPAVYSPYVFVKPKINVSISLPSIKPKRKPYIFPHVARIGVNTKEGIARLGMIVYPSINNSNSKKILKDKNYMQECIDGQLQLSFLAKNLNNLESLVKELREIFPVLLQK